MKTFFLLTTTMCAALIFAACTPPAANSGNGNSSNNGAKPGTSAPANNTTGAAADNAAVAADIKKLVADYATSTAKNDADAYDKITTDNFMFVGNDGSIQTKSERVSAMKSGQTKYDVLTYDDINVRVNPEGNGAVVIAKATVKGLNMGNPIDSTVRVTQVWSKTKDGWKMASLQATDIKAVGTDKKSETPPANK